MSDTIIRDKLGTALVFDNDPPPINTPTPISEEAKQRDAERAARFKALRVRKYSDDEPRDERGRWTDGGGGSFQQKGGAWVHSSGRAASASETSRMKALRVPPAWSNVRLNPDSKGELQVIGVDSKGRSQYLYSAEHAEKSAAAKFGRLQAFNKAVPGIRSQALKDMNNTRLSQHERDAAAATYLIDQTGFRVGSTSDTGAEKQAYGATTLLGSHVKVSGDKVAFAFTGKKGVSIGKSIENKQLAQYIAARKAEVGKGRLFSASSSDVRSYVKEASGNKAFKPKDYRTYHGTSLALQTIKSMPVPKSQAEFNRARKAVAKVVSDHLGNTPSVALSAYIDPAVFHSWSKFK